MRFLYTKFKPVSYWKIAPGREAKYWEDCKMGKYICLGWDSAGDLRQYSDKETLRQAVLAEDRNFTKRQAEQMLNFRDLEDKDIVIANRGMTSIVGVGRVTGRYYFNGERADYKHCVAVEWFHTSEYLIADKDAVSNWFSWTVKKLTREEYEHLSPGMESLRWRRVAEDSFDLMLMNAGALDRKGIAGLYDEFMNSECVAQPDFSQYLREDLSSWIENPESPLPSVAYASLSNWFKTAFTALNSRSQTA